MPDLPNARLFAATVTPFTIDGHLDHEALTQHLQRLIAAGVDGIVVAGSTGEGTALTTAEKVELVLTTTAATGGRAAVLAATGERDTTEGIVEANALRRAGVDGLLVSAPAASRPTPSGLLAHVRAIADAGDVPVMIYDNPRRFGIGFPIETLAAAGHHPAIWAIKDATEDPHRVAELAATCDLAYYAGSDDKAGAIAMGGHGLVGVGVNVDPGAYRAYVDALVGGDGDLSVQLGKRLSPLIRALHAHVPPAVATKAVLRGLELLPCARVRLPLVGPEAHEAEAIRQDLKLYDGDSGDLWKARCGALHLDQGDLHGGALRWAN